MTSGTDGPPLSPSSSQAREWVRDELSHGGYDTQPSWWQRFLEWLHGHLSGPAGQGLPTWVVALAGLLVLLALAVAVVTVVTPEGRLRHRRRDRTGVLDEPSLTAASYRRRAGAALDRGDWDAALLDAYRALAASAQERTLLSELPGRTAHEVADTLVPFFPAHGQGLTGAARAFDEVRYGRRPASAVQARQVLALEEAIRQAAPQFAQAAPR